MKRKIVISLILLAMLVTACMQDLGAYPTNDPDVIRPMDMIQTFAAETSVAQSGRQSVPFATPSPTPHPRLDFVVVTQDGDVFGFDDNALSTIPLQVIVIDGFDYRGMPLFDLLSSINSVKFGARKIEIQGDTTFVFEFDQISNQTLNLTLVVKNQSGNFDVVSPVVPKEQWVTNVKIFRVR